MDEPLGKLDPKIRKKFRHELRRLIKTLNLTAIQVTHDQEEAMAIADEIIVMRKGKILQRGKPQDLYYHPNSIFVANFFGETNFMEGFVSEVRPSSCLFHLHLGGPKFKINLPQNHSLKNHVQVIIAYRIEDIELIKLKKVDKDRQDSDNNSLKMNVVEGKIKDIIFIGPMKRFIIELDNGDVIHVKHSSKFLMVFEKGEKILTGFHEYPMVFPYPEDLRNELSKA